MEYLLCKFCSDVELNGNLIRLGKKLLDPLTNLINTTSAMSLLYECIMTMIKGMPSHTSSIQLCVSKLSLFVEDADQNLKYLGLLALGEIVKEHSKIIQPQRDMVCQSHYLVTSETLGSYVCISLVL